MRAFGPVPILRGTASRALGKPHGPSGGTFKIVGPGGLTHSFANTMAEALKRTRALNEAECREVYKMLFLPQGSF